MLVRLRSFFTKMEADAQGLYIKRVLHGDLNTETHLCQNTNVATIMCLSVVQMVIEVGCARTRSLGILSRAAHTHFQGLCNSTDRCKSHRVGKADTPVLSHISCTRLVSLCSPSDLQAN